MGSLAGQVDQVIVVDNSADADASTQLQERLARHVDGSAAPRVRVLKPARNLGFAGGVNLALRELGDASWDACLLLNNDARLAAGAVGQLVAALRGRAGRAIVAPAKSDDGVPMQLWYHRLLGLITRHRLPGSFPYLSGTCLLVPRALAAGRLFDEAFFMYGEDVELAWRLRRQGVALAVVPGVGMAHHGSASAPRGSVFHEYHVARAHVVLARKLTDGPVERVLGLVLRALLLSLRAVLRSLRSRSGVPLHALLELVRHRADGVAMTKAEPARGGGR